MKQDYYYPLIFGLIFLNILLYPVTIQGLPLNSAKDNLLQSYTESLFLFLISYNLLGLIIGGGIAAFSKNKSQPLRERTKDKSLKVILIINLAFLIAEIGELLF